MTTPDTLISKNMKKKLLDLSADQFVALILDNEVTVGEFVVAPPLPWTRLVQRDGIFQVAEGYPNTLTPTQGKLEMRNWDQVSLPSVVRLLAELDDGVDYVLFGNNAGQGLPLAQALPSRLIADRAAIIYAHSLPEKRAYEQMGYRNFFRRSEAVFHLGQLANRARQPLALCFINTIQHNEFNYHDP
jgi:hypothetical protein